MQKHRNEACACLFSCCEFGVSCSKILNTDWLSICMADHFAFHKWVAQYFTRVKISSRHSCVMAGDFVLMAGLLRFQLSTAPVALVSFCLIAVVQLDKTVIEVLQIPMFVSIFSDNLNNKIECLLCSNTVREERFKQEFSLSWSYIGLHKCHYCSRNVGCM